MRAQIDRGAERVAPVSERGSPPVGIPPRPGEETPWLRGGDGTPVDVRGPVCFLQ